MENRRADTFFHALRFTGRCETTHCDSFTPRNRSPSLRSKLRSILNPRDRSFRSIRFNFSFFLFSHSPFDENEGEREREKKGGAVTSGVIERNTERKTRRLIQLVGAACCQNTPQIVARPGKRSPVPFIFQLQLVSVFLLQSTLATFRFSRD